MVARVSPPKAERGRFGRFVALGVIAVAAALSLSGCDAKNWFALGWPHGGISVQSHKMYDLWIGTVIVAAIVGIVVYALILWCIVRYRKRGDELPAQTRYNLPLEMIYTVIPFVIIAVLFYYTAVAETDVNKLSAKPDVTVQIVAFKWNWQFNYLDASAKMPDGSEVTTIGDSNYIPELVVPIGKTIQFVENSKDVIHSFWVPDLLFKRDVFPGNATNRFQVTIIQTGQFVGRCAELCGTYHSQMNFELDAVTPDQYAQFIQLKQQGLSTPAALLKLGYTKNGGYATTTQPFNTSRTSNNAT